MKTFADLWLEGTSMHFSFWVPDFSGEISVWVNRSMDERTPSYSGSALEPGWDTMATTDADGCTRFTIPFLLQGNFKVSLEDSSGNWMKRIFNISKDARKTDKNFLMALGDVVANGNSQPGPNFAFFSAGDAYLTQSTASLIQNEKIVGWALGEPFINVRMGFSGHPHSGLLFRKFIWLSGPPASPESFVFSLKPNAKSGSVSKLEEEIIFSATQAISPSHPIGFYSIPTFQIMPDEVILP